MFDILKSVWNYAFGWIFRAVVIKFTILTAIYSVIAWLASAVLSQLDISPLTGLQTALDSIPTGVLWFMLLFKLDIGLPIVLGAMLTKFLIRRLPIIG